MLELFVRILKSINFTIKYFYFSETKIYIQPKCKKKRQQKSRTDIGARLRFLLNHVKNWIQFSSDCYLWLQIKNGVLARNFPKLIFYVCEWFSDWYSRDRQKLAQSI